MSSTVSLTDVKLATEKYLGRNAFSQHRLSIRRFNELSESELETWIRFHRYPSFQSPYFHPEFTKAVSQIRDDVHIAVISNKSGETLGFFPFQHTRGFAEPVGGRLNDFHGVVGHRKFRPNVRALLRELGLHSFKFHALVNDHLAFDQFAYRKLGSHRIDLSKGFAAYQQWVCQHSSTVKRQPQKTRALEREVGPLRFEFDCRDPQVLEKLIELKRSKYQRTKTFDILSVEWAANTLREVFAVQKPDFQGRLSVLWAGDQLVACHFGMVNQDVLHYWFPVYDQQYNKYSPGTILLLESCKKTADNGIEAVELGYGDDAYKFKFVNSRSTVISGFVSKSTTREMLNRLRFEARLLSKQIPFKQHVKKMLRRVYPGFGGWNFR